MTFRSENRACASCASPMEAFFVAMPGGESAEVDQCPSCGGVFLDYFDGEPSELAREIAQARRRGAGAAAVAEACPSCRVALYLAPYLGDGPEMYRCGDCGGAFITSFQLSAVASFRPPSTPPSTKPTLFELLRRWLAR